MKKNDALYTTTVHLYSMSRSKANLTLDKLIQEGKIVEAEDYLLFLLRTKCIPLKDKPCPKKYVIVDNNKYLLKTLYTDLINQYNPLLKHKIIIYKDNTSNDIIYVK